MVGGGWVLSLGIFGVKGTVDTRLDKEPSDFSILMFHVSIWKWLFYQNNK